MPEFRKIIQTPPLRLSKNDIEVLARLMLQGMSTNSQSCEFTLEAKDAKYRSDSIEELLAQNLPPQVDGLSFTVRGWTDNKIDRGISMSLQPTFGNYQIHSHDEVWFRGKIQQLTQFMQDHGPWYRHLISTLPGIFGAGFSALLIAILTALNSGNHFSAALSVVAFGALLLASLAHLRGSFLPHCKLILSMPRNLLNAEAWMLIFTAISTVAALAGVIIPLFNSKGSP